MVDLTAETADLWCFLVLMLVVEARTETASEWLDAARVALEGSAPVPWPDWFGGLVKGGLALVRGAPTHLILDERQVVGMTVTYAICDYVTGNTLHVYEDRTRVSAEVTYCSSFLAKTEHAQVQAILHEILHAMNGMGECAPIFFEYWVSYLATGTYSPSDYDWADNDCGDLRALPPAT